MGKYYTTNNLLYSFQLKAINYANNNGGTTVGICGYSGRKLSQIVEIPILIKIDDMQKEEDVQMIVVHITMQRLWQELNQIA